MPTYAENRKARFDFDILEKYEAGISLFGFEVKAVRNGHINLAGSYVTAKDDRLWLLNADIPPYQPKNTPDDYDSKRTRPLLLHKKEIKTLTGKIKEKGLTMVPLRVYTKGRHIKVEIGLGKSRKKTDKRELIKKREVDRKIRKVVDR